MSRVATKRQLRIRRHARVRALIKGTPIRPRMAVFRSNRYLWVQLIDDEKRHTIVSATNRATAPKNRAKKAAVKETRGSEISMARAQELGAQIARKAKEKHITTCVFDRGGFSYHGLIRAVAEGARKEGLTF